MKPKTITIDHVEIHLSEPDDLPLEWVGRAELLAQLSAAWMKVDPADVPMNQTLGFQQSVRGGNSGTVQAKLVGKLTRRRKTGAVGKRTPPDRTGNLFI